MKPNVILSLPVNFASPQRASQPTITEREPNKNFGRKDTGSTAATDLTSSFRSSYSIGTNDDFGGFIASLEASARYCHDADATTALEDDKEEEQTEIKKIAVPHNQAKFDSLAIKVAQLEEKHKKLGRQMRRMKHQVRILDAEEEYLGCLEALVLSSMEMGLSDEFLKDHDLIWKEVEFDSFE